MDLTGNNISELQTLAWINVKLVIAGFLIVVGGVGLLIFCCVWARVRSRRQRLLRRLRTDQARGAGCPWLSPPPPSLRLSWSLPSCC